MNLSFNKEKVSTTIWKSTVTSYGLTLVVGLPFPHAICTRIRYVQEQLDILTSGGFTWYDCDHLHTTLVAPLRGHYRELPPLRRGELPSNLDGFTSDLSDWSTKLQPFPLEFSNVEITGEGLVMIAANNHIQNQRFTFLRYPKLDEPKQDYGLHITIGFLKSQELFASNEAQKRLGEGLSKIMYSYIGQIMVQQVWLVHYANRTLNRIVGKIALELGKPNSLTTEKLLNGLGIISETPPFL